MVFVYVLLFELLQANTHTRFRALCPGLPGWAGTRKVKPIWILLKQETASGSGIGWAICKSAPCSRQITVPTPHHSSFFYRPDALPAAQPTASKHWRQNSVIISCQAYVARGDSAVLLLCRRPCICWVSESMRLIADLFSWKPLRGELVSLQTWTNDWWTSVTFNSDWLVLKRLLHCRLAVMEQSLYLVLRQITLETRGMLWILRMLWWSSWTTWQLEWHWLRTS